MRFEQVLSHIFNFVFLTVMAGIDLLSPLLNNFLSSRNLLNHCVFSLYYRAFFEDPFNRKFSIDPAQKISSAISYELTGIVANTVV